MAMTNGAHRCPEFGWGTASGKHHAAEHVHNPHLGDTDYCTGCLRRLIFVQHSTLPGMDWIRVTDLLEWP
jgi:hypothetical protein